MRNAARRQVSENQNDEEHRQKCIFDKVGAEIISVITKNKDGRSQYLYCRIDGRYRCMTGTATSVKNQIAEDGDIVMPTDRRPATGAMRPGSDD